jgi:2-haloalkanoic acid dehalogenase type II
MPPPYQAVFFDLGGTLFSYREVGRWTLDALVSAAARLGVDVSTREIGMAYRAASREVNLGYADRAFYLHSDLFRDTFRAFAEGLGGEASEEFLDGSVADLRDALVSNMVLREDCLETLRQLRDQGLYLSIVSNIDDDHLLPMVENSGLKQVLHHWTSSEEARSCKPDPAFFRLALKKAGCSPEAVLFVGDSPEHDIQGAQNLGMTTALIKEEGTTAPLQTGRVTAAPDHEISSLSELISLVSR